MTTPLVLVYCDVLNPRIMLLFHLANSSSLNALADEHPIEKFMFIGYMGKINTLNNYFVSNFFDL